MVDLGGNAYYQYGISAHISDFKLATSHKLYAFTFNAHVQKVNRDIEVFLGFCFPESREIFGSLRGRIFVVY